MPNTAARDIHKTINAYFAATRMMDREAWVSQFAAAASSCDPVGSPARVGHKQLGAFFDSIVDLAESIGLSEDAVFVCGDQAAVKWTGRGVGKNGKRFVFEGIDIFEFDEQGRISSAKGFWDPQKLMAQLK